MRMQIGLAVIVALIVLPASDAVGISAPGFGPHVEGRSGAVAVGVWGHATEIPDFSVLSSRGRAALYTLSCGEPGSCAAGGTYLADGHHHKSFLATESHGVWGIAMDVPGLNKLPVVGDSGLDRISCVAAGVCSAVGSFVDAAKHTQLYGIEEKGGRWSRAVEIPAESALGASGVFLVNALSCGSEGNCALGGQYRDAARDLEAYVVSEVGGTWRKAIEVPGSAALNVGGSSMYGASVTSLSCRGPGSCSAVGEYVKEDTLAFFDQEAFVVDETGGVWGTAVQAPGTASLNVGMEAALNAVSCASPRNCSAGGYYFDNNFDPQAFAIEETNGTWGIAAPIPGSIALNGGASNGYGAAVTTISCTTPGNCAAGGNYAEGWDSALGFVQQAFVADEIDGTWHDAIGVPGFTALNHTSPFGLFGVFVSCGAPGACSVGGSFLAGDRTGRAYIDHEVHDHWGRTHLLGGVAGPHVALASQIDALSCTAVLICNAAGVYSTGHVDAFVMAEMPMLPPIVVRLSPNTGPPGGGNVVVIHGLHLTSTIKVLFGSRPCRQLSIVNAGAVRVSVPAGSGVVDVRVWTGAGVSSTTRGDRYRYG